MLFELFLTSAALASAAPSSLQARQGPTFYASYTQCVILIKRAHVRFTDDCHRYSGCNQPSVACGLNGGQYHAAVSQNFFGVGPGAGAGPGCGICFSLTSSVPGTVPITVKIDNLCPADRNPLCAQDGLQGTNSMGMSSSATIFSQGCCGLTMKKVRISILISVQMMGPQAHSSQDLKLGLQREPLLKSLVNRSFGCGMIPLWPRAGQVFSLHSFLFVQLKIPPHSLWLANGSILDL